MLEIIEYPRVREQLDAAKSATPEQAVQHLANAFEFLIEDFSNFMGASWPSAFRQITAERVPDKELHDVLISLQEVQTITSLGLDYKKYMKFKIICPVKHFGSSHSSGGGRRTPENLRFAIEYVVECALKLQSFPKYGDIWEHVGKPDLSNL